MLTRTVEEYLEAVFHLKGQEKPVSTSDLAKEIGVSPPSASSMMKKLSKAGFVKYKSRKGITLTKKGEKEAAKMVRRHRISERFLTDVLGLDWEEAHKEACKFEHVLSDDVEERLDEVLGSPKTCPHGNPIPSKTGTVTEKKAEPLSKLKPKEHGVVTKITGEQPKLLHYLATLGLMPQALVEVCEVAPFAGPLLIKVTSQASSHRGRGKRRARGGSRKGRAAHGLGNHKELIEQAKNTRVSPGKRGATYALGREIASHIWVKKGK